MSKVKKARSYLSVKAKHPISPLNVLLLVSTVTALGFVIKLTLASSGTFTPGQGSLPATPSSIPQKAGSAFGLVNTGHIEDTQWNLQDSTNGYSDLTVDIKPAFNYFPPNQAYFYANNVWFNKYTGTNGGAAYAGLQTNGNDGTKAVGKMLIFSVWDATSAIPVKGGTATTFGGEGTGYSVHYAYNWQAGRTYRVRIGLLSTNGSSNVWEASVTDLTSHRIQKIGQILVPASFGHIYGPVTFHERYLGQPTACNLVTPSQVTFTNMSANNGTLRGTSWGHYYSQNVTGCTNYMWLKDLDGGYTSSVGVYKR